MQMHWVQATVHNHSSRGWFQEGSPTHKMGSNWHATVMAPAYLHRLKSTIADPTDFRFCKAHRVIDVDFEGAARARTPNNWEMPILSSVITTPFPHYFGFSPIFLTSLRQCTELPDVWWSSDNSRATTEQQHWQQHIMQQHYMRCMTTGWCWKQCALQHEATEA